MGRFPQAFRAYLEKAARSPMESFWTRLSFLHKHRAMIWIISIRPSPKSPLSKPLSRDPLLAAQDRRVVSEA